MTDEEKDIEIIERYLEGKLDTPEFADFQERLACDEEFEKSFKTYSILTEGLKSSGRNALLQKLKKLEASITVEESFNKNNFGISLKSIYSYSAAATILLLITFAFVFIIRYDSSPTEIFTEQFEPYPNVVMPTTRGEDPDKSFIGQAYHLYDLKEYKNAAILFEKTLATGERDPAVLLYGANAYMALGEFDSAIVKLEALIEKKSQFHAQGLWFLSLAYLAKDQPGKAKKHLNELKDQNISYSKKASKILDGLK